MLSGNFFFSRSENSHFSDFSFFRILTLSLGFLIIPFLPASNLFFRVGFVIAERVLYLPSAGYCMLLTFGFGALSKHTKKKVLAQSDAVRNQDGRVAPAYDIYCSLSLPKKWIAAVILGILFINVLRCVIRSGEWRNEEQLFRSALSVCPLNAKVCWPPCFFRKTSVWQLSKRNVYLHTESSIRPRPNTWFFSWVLLMILIKLTTIPRGRNNSKKTITTR